APFVLVGQGDRPVWPDLEIRWVSHLLVQLGELPEVQTHHQATRTGPQAGHKGAPPMSARIDVTFNPALAEYSAKTTHAGAGLPEKPASQTGRTPMVATFGPIESEPRSL